MAVWCGGTAGEQPIEFPFVFGNGRLGPQREGPTLAGLALAAAGTRLVARYGPQRIPFLKEVSLDGRVFAFAILATLLTGILFGLAPALAAFQVRLSETLKEGSIAAESRARNRFRGALVVIEVAIAMLLTIGATLTMRTLLRLQATKPGFDAEGVLTASITLPTTKYAKPEQRFAFYQRLLDRVRVMPGVQAASMVSLIPLGGSNTGRNFIIEGQPAPRPEDAPIFWRRVIDPDYFPRDEDSPRPPPRIYVAGRCLASHCHHQ